MPEDVFCWNHLEPNNRDGLEHFVSVQPRKSTDLTNWNDQEYDTNNEISSVCERKSGLTVQSLIEYGRAFMLLGKNYEIIEISGCLRIYFGFEQMDLTSAIHYCNKSGGRVYEPRRVDHLIDVQERAYNASLWFGFWLGITDMAEEGR